MSTPGGRDRSLAAAIQARRSAPVRVGNGAVDQLQLDNYGELISAAHELDRLGGKLEDELRDFLSHVPDQACASWQTPDCGLWEQRNGAAVQGVREGSWPPTPWRSAAPSGVHARPTGDRPDR
jgi:GH15 family glucan-1,4-alpha-glucosidase